MKSILAVATALLCAMSSSIVDARVDDHLEYKTVTGYFLQDEASTNPSGFDYTAHNFGLISRPYDTDHKQGQQQHLDATHKKSDWERFARKLASLNAQCDRHTSYKLLFLGRHGEGFHNVAESYYGTPAWNCYWSIRDGNGTSVWADARLTESGAAQATKAHDFWGQTMREQNMPPPHSFYASPLTRCLRTAELTFAGLHVPAWDRRGPEVKELFREGISGHTCDRRGSRSYIRKSFPHFRIEKGFSEEDKLFKPLLQETPVDQDIRTKKVLDEVFSEDKEAWISVTSHSGEIASILRVVGHQKFSLGTGQVIPVLIQAKRVGGKGKVVEPEPYTPIETCSEAPPLPTATTTA